MANNKAKETSKNPLLKEETINLVGENLANRTVTINDKRYNINDLSKKAQELVFSLKVTNQEITRVQDQIAIAKTARNAYGVSLEPNLPEKEAAKNKKKDVVTINEKRYSYDDMSEKAMADIMSISVVDKKLTALEADLAIAKTAKSFYTKALLEEVK